MKMLRKSYCDYTISMNTAVGFQILTEEEFQDMRTNLRELDELDDMKGFETNPLLYIKE